MNMGTSAKDAIQGGNMGVWVAVGVGIGIAVDVATGDLAVWLALGAGVGVGLGAALSRRQMIDLPIPESGINWWLSEKQER